MRLGGPAQGLERAEEAAVGLVAPADIARAAPARRPQRVEAPVVADAGVGVRLDVVLGQLGQRGPGLQVTRMGGGDRGDGALGLRAGGCGGGGKRLLPLLGRSPAARSRVALG